MHVIKILCSNDEISQNPGFYIREIRNKAEISLRELARRIDVSHVFIGGLERGKKQIPDGMVNRLANQLPGLSQKKLRLLIKKSKPIELEIKLHNIKERDLVLEFARRVKRGFTEAEYDQLKRIMEV